MNEKTKILLAHLKGIGAVPFAAAVILFLAPLFGLAYGAGVATAMLFGGAAILLWAKSVLQPDRIDPWLTIAVGGCAVLSPWVIGFGYMSSSSFAIHTLAGLAIVGAAAYEMLKARQTEKSDSGPDEEAKAA